MVGKLYLVLAVRLGEPITCATSMREGEASSIAGRLGEGVAQSSSASSLLHREELGRGSLLSLAGGSRIEASTVDLVPTSDTRFISWYHSILFIHS